MDWFWKDGSALGPLRILLVTSIVAPALLFMAASWIEYRRTFRDAEQDVTRASEVAREHAAKVFDTHELIADRIEGHDPGPQRQDWKRLTIQMRRSGFDLADLDQDHVGDLTAFVGATTGLLSDDDVALAAAEIEPGTAALMIVYENRWAGPFVAAVRRSGGELIAFERIRTGDLLAALDAAEAAA